MDEQDPAESRDVESHEEAPHFTETSRTSKRDRWLVVGVVAGAIALVAMLGMMLFMRTVIVPDITGRTTNEATEMLNVSGLQLGESSKLATSTTGAGLILEQSPPGETNARRNTSVDVTIAVPPTPAKVPDVAGKSETEARATLEEALFVPQRVDVFDASRTVGVVLGQAPGPGASWTTGRPVALAVVVGPDDGTGVKIPDVVGQDLERAMATLSAATLGAYGVVRDLDQPGANEVERQLPEPGLVVRPGTTVLLYLKAP